MSDRPTDGHRVDPQLAFGIKNVLCKIYRVMVRFEKHVPSAAQVVGTVYYMLTDEQNGPD